MALAFTLVDSWDDGRRIHMAGTIVVSGNYVTGSDALDLSSIGAAGVPTTNLQFRARRGWMAWQVMTMFSRRAQRSTRTK